MALLADGELNQVADLRNYDSSVLEVAAVEGIDLTAKLELAREALLSEARTALGRGAAQPYQTGQVAATPDLTRMHAYTTLEFVYRDAYFSQLNDRYGGRWREYRREALNAWERVRANGLGIVVRPISRSSVPTLTLTAGGFEPATYYVQTTWTRQDGAESEPSEVVTITGAAGHGLSVAPAPAPADVDGWNIFIGYSTTALQKQNSTRLTPGQAWTLPSSVLQPGLAAGRGQTPDIYFQPQRGTCRG
jgi:hypothetical protein